MFQGVFDFNKDVLTSASVPQCFSSSLKVFQFKGFNVREHELLLAKFMMEKAAVLERMTIHTAFWLKYSDIDMEKVKEHILSFTKCSSYLVIEFSQPFFYIIKGNSLFNLLKWIDLNFFTHNLIFLFFYILKSYLF